MILYHGNKTGDKLTDLNFDNGQYFYLTPIYRYALQYAKGNENGVTKMDIDTSRLIDLKFLGISSIDVKKFYEKTGENFPVSKVRMNNKNSSLWELLRLDFDGDIRKGFIHKGYDGLIMIEKSSSGELFESYVLFNTKPIDRVLSEMRKLIRKRLNEGIVNIEAEKLLNWFNSKRDSTFVFFDTETTGFKRSEGNQLTQIGAISCYFNPETYRFVEMSKFNEMVRLNDEMMKQVDSERDLELPDDRKELLKHLGNSKRAVLKYNHYDIDKSGEHRDEEEALDGFRAYLEDQYKVVLLAHNAPFDLSFVEFKGIVGIGDMEIFDTLDFFRNVFHPILNRIKDSDVRGKELYDRIPNNKEKKSSSLPDLVKGFTVDADSLYRKLNTAHEAVTDCRNTMEVFESAISIIRSHLNSK